MTLLLPLKINHFVFVYALFQMSVLCPLQIRFFSFKSQLFCSLLRLSETDFSVPSDSPEPLSFNRTFKIETEGLRLAMCGCSLAWFQRVKPASPYWCFFANFLHLFSFSASGFFFLQNDLAGEINESKNNQLPPLRQSLAKKFLVREAFESKEGPVSSLREYQNLAKRLSQERIREPATLLLQQLWTPFLKNVVIPQRPLFLFFLVERKTSL
jgi:hypothetical protein